MQVQTITGPGVSGAYHPSGFITGPGNDVPLTPAIPTSPVYSCTA